ncbi:MAG: glycosyltransferase [SAR86 cluster bacterium]|nr:glycosyltransferase [SAR86 cluster bacterium]
MDTISIVIPVLDPGDTLVRVLDSLTIQSKLPEEVILVDASKDRKTESLVKSYSEVLNIVHKKTDKPSYPGRNRNIGASVAKGKVLAFIDSKTVADKEWLKESLKKLSSNSYRVVFGFTKYEALSKVQKIIRAASFGLLGHETAPGTVMTKEDFINSGGFIEDVRAGEDQEWRQRIKDLGYKYTKLDKPYLTYVDLPKSITEMQYKYFIYSIHAARVNVLNNMKDLYLTLTLFLSALIVPRWNFMITGWDQNPLFIPNITKIYLLSLILLLLVYLLFQNVLVRKSEALFFNSLKILVFVFLCLAVFNWNAVIAGWVEDAMLYIPHITKIYLVSIFVASLFYRGLYVPFKGKIGKDYLFPFRWIYIGLVGLSFDIIKAPGYLLGALLAPFLFLRKNK